MNIQRRFSVVFTGLVLALGVVGAGTAAASPDGDEDPSFNPGGSGSQYAYFPYGFSHGRPLTAVDPRDGSSVTATLGTVGVGLVAFGPDGERIGRSFPNVDLTQSEFALDDLLDLRVLADGSVRALVRVSHEVPGARPGDPRRRLGELRQLRFGEDGSYPTVIKNQAPAGCFGSGTTSPTGTTVDAARIAADGTATALWDCRYGSSDADLWVAHYGTEPDPNLRLTPELTARRVDGRGFGGEYGKDLEFGPSGDPYVLVGRGNASVVHRFAGTTLARRSRPTGSTPVAGRAVDLAVDALARPLVWSQTSPGAGRWRISRLRSGLNTLDRTWGTQGVTTIRDARLPAPDGGPVVYASFARKPDFLAVRPGGRVLALASEVGESDGNGNAVISPRAGILAGLTAAGRIDSAFANSGFKEVTDPQPPQDGDGQPVQFIGLGEPAFQADGKVLLPYAAASTTYSQFFLGARRLIATPLVVEGAPYR